MYESEKVLVVFTLQSTRCDIFSKP